MTLLALGIFALGLAAGGVGGLLGLGGGIFIVPGLSLLFGVPMKGAIAASSLCVIATSLGASSVYVREGVANVRLGILLQIATAAGALGGGLASVAIHPQWLSLIFAAVAIYVAYAMRFTSKASEPVSGEGPYCGDFYDQSAACQVQYQPHHLSTGMAGSVGAGFLAGLLGVGGGVIQVPIMSRLMGVPLKAAIGTSSFMMGATAATSALVYYAHGFVEASVAVPAVLGVFLGARLASTFGSRAKRHVLEIAFQIFLVLVALYMGYKAFVP